MNDVSLAAAPDPLKAATLHVTEVLRVVSTVMGKGSALGLQIMGGSLLILGFVARIGTGLVPGLQFSPGDLVTVFVGGILLMIAGGAMSVFKFAAIKAMDREALRLSYEVTKAAQSHSAAALDAFSQRLAALERQKGSEPIL
jgi:hypothetical protein